MSIIDFGLKSHNRKLFFTDQKTDFLLKVKMKNSKLLSHK